MGIPADFANSATDLEALVAYIRRSLGFPPPPGVPFAYVGDNANGNVYVIDTATNTAMATIATGATNVGAIAITPDGAFAYVGDSNSGDVYVIDTATNTVVATIATGAARAGAIAITALVVGRYGVRIGAGVPAGPPLGTELPIAIDTTAVSGGFYAWSGAAWVKGATI